MCQVLVVFLKVELNPRLTLSLRFAVWEPVQYVIIFIIFILLSTGHQNDIAKQFNQKQISILHLLELKKGLTPKIR